MPGKVLSKKQQLPQTDEEKVQVQGLPYAQIVGALLYLAYMSRNDITYGCGQLLFEVYVRFWYGSLVGSSTCSPVLAQVSEVTGDVCAVREWRWADTDV